MLRLEKRSNSPSSSSSPSSPSTSEARAPLGTMDLSGSLTRQSEQSHPCPNPVSHILNLGRMVEALESTMRANLQEIYLGKTREIVGTLRARESLADAHNAERLRREILDKMRR